MTAATSNLVVTGLQEVRAYVNDIAIYSASWEYHVEGLEALLEELARINLTLNLS